MPAPVPPSDRTDPERTTPLQELGSDARSGDDTDFTLAAEPAPASPFPPRIGRYQVVREVARGGMGSVLAAVDPEMGREVAIKLLLPAHQSKPVFAERFVDEARLTGLLTHPGIVPVYEMGQLPDARPYFVMRMVEGNTLDSLLVARRKPTDDLPRFLCVFERVCQTVAYAHSRGVVHGDLKPLNVMVGPYGVVNVMDWGVARVLPEPEGPAPACGPCPDTPDVAGNTRFASVTGTPAYMAPEQAHGDSRRVDQRTDVFGLGGILCATLTGMPPYPGSGTRKVYSQAARGDLGETLARLDAAPVDRELVSLAKACLAPNPDDRPDDAGEVGAALTAYLESTLRRAESDLVRFFELSPDLFCIAGFDGYFRRVNPNFSRVLGYSPEELISRPFIEFVHPEDRAGTLAAAEQLSRGVPVTHFRNRYRDTAGRYRWFEWAGQSIPVEAVIFAVARDITERVELEARLRVGTDTYSPS